MSGRTGKGKAKPRTLSAKSGVLFPVARMKRYFKKQLIRHRIGIGAPIYTAAVIEYLTAEVLELAGNAARDNKRHRITPRHILLAVANDDELHTLLQNVTIPAGGVVPSIRPELLGRKKGGKFWSDLPPDERAQLKHETIKKLPVSSPKSHKTTKSTAIKSPPPKKSHEISPAPRKTPVKNPTAVSHSDDLRAPGTICEVTGLKILDERMLYLGQRVTVVEGDISSVPLDAVVHPTDASFSLADDIGKALVKVGGKDFEDEVNGMLDAQGELAIAGASICRARGRLPFKFILHINGPAFSQQGSQQLLHKTIRNILFLSDNKRIKSLAMPDINTTSMAFPPSVAIPITLRSINNYFQTTMSSGIKQIFVVLTPGNPEIVSLYRQELAKLEI